MASSNQKRGTTKSQKVSPVRKLLDDFVKYIARVQTGRAGVRSDRIRVEVKKGIDNSIRKEYGERKTFTDDKGIAVIRAISDRYNVPLPGRTSEFILQRSTNPTLEMTTKTDKRAATSSPGLEIDSFFYTRKWLISHILNYFKEFYPNASRLERFRADDVAICVFESFSIRPLDVKGVLTRSTSALEHRDYPSTFRLSKEDVLCALDADSWEASSTVFQSLSVCVVDLEGYFLDISWAMYYQYSEMETRGDEDDDDSNTKEETIAMIDPTYVDDALFNKYKGADFDRMRACAKQYCETVSRWTIKKSKKKGCSQLRVAVLHVSDTSRIISIPNSTNTHRLIIKMCNVHGGQDSFLDKEIDVFVKLYKQRKLYGDQNKVYEFQYDAVKSAGGLVMLKSDADDEEIKVGEDGLEVREQLHLQPPPPLPHPGSGR